MVIYAFNLRCVFIILNMNYAIEFFINIKKYFLYLYLELKNVIRENIRNFRDLKRRVIRKIFK